MKIDSKHAETVECQFDVYCKKIAHNVAKNIYEKEKKYNQYNVSLELNMEQVNKSCTWDCYKTETTHFQTHGYTVLIEDETIAKAIAKLPRKQRDVILLSFFTDLNNKKAATVIGISQSTLHHHKASALANLHKLIKTEELQ